MPKLAKTMSAKELGAIISTEGVHSVGGVLGLALRVRKRRDGTFSRTWILRQQRTVTGQQFKVTIGEYPSISLAKARNLATEILLSRENPITVRQQEQEARRLKEEERLKRLPFSVVAQKAIDELARTNFWKDARSVERETHRLQKHVFPILGEMAVQDITSRDIVALFSKADLIALTRSSLDKVKAIVGKVFDFAARTGLIEESPMQTAQYRSFMKTLPKSQTTSRNMGALHPEELPDFVNYLVQRINASEGVEMSSLCLLLSILTNVRSENARGARWSCIDLDKGLWTIPKKEMKVPKNGDHPLFLSKQTISLLKALPIINGSQYVFPSAGNRPYRETVFGRLLIRINNKRTAQGLEPYIDKAQSAQHGCTIKVTQHGIARATYKTWTQTAVDHRGLPLNAKTVEFSLHHMPSSEGNLGTAYEREQFTEERKEIAQLWADYCFSEVSPSELKKLFEPKNKVTRKK